MAMTKMDVDLASDLGHELAEQFIPLIEGVPIPVMFNTLGALTEAVFAGMMQHGHPLAHVLEEFDNWTAYVRGRIETELRGRMS